jgi:hypothetical protein
VTRPLVATLAAVALVATVGGCGAPSQTWFPHPAPGERVQVQTATPEATSYRVTTKQGDTYLCTRTAPTWLLGDSELACKLSTPAPVADHPTPDPSHPGHG